ncbi:hypothetical protein AAY473_005955 [Plecturocebus cupreus]
MKRWSFNMLPRLVLNSWPQVILPAQPPKPGDSRQRSHTGRQHDSFGRRGCFAGVPARRFPVRSIWTDGLGWSHPHKENSNWKR